MDAMDAILTRKSIRKYQTEQIEDHALVKIVEAAKSAPNAGPIQITVIQNKELLSEISGEALKAMKDSGNAFLMERAALPGYSPTYGAPTLILLSAPSEHKYGQVNTSIAAANITVAATALGLGSCFMVTPALALAAKPALKSKTGIPDGYSVICGVVVGYADGNAFSTERPVENNIRYIK